MPLARALFLVVLLAACSAPHEREGSLTTVDTVGDTVVARTSAQSAAPLLALVLEQSTGEADAEDDYTIGDNVLVAIGRTGEIYQWDRQSNQLLLHDSSGKFVKTIGRAGAGPGEYARLNGIAVRNDGKLVVWDAGNARVNTYSASGEYESTWSAQPTYGTSHNTMLVDSAGQIYLQKIVQRDSTVPFGLDGYERHAPDGRILDSLVPPDFKVDRPVLTSSDGSSSMSWAVPFFPNPRFTVAVDGGFVTGPGDPYVVHKRNANSTLRIVRDVRGPRVQEEEKQERRDIILWRLRRIDPKYQWSGPDIPNHKPAYGDIKVDSDNRIWVLTSQPSERIPVAERSAQLPNTAPRITWREPTVYDVFSSKGAYIAQVRFPSNATFIDSRENRVWAITLDSLDVPSVTRFRVNPSFGMPK